MVFLFTAIICLAFVSTFAAAATEVTIEGNILEGYQLAGDDNQVYDLADDEKGNEVGEMVGSRVKVTGKLQESEGAKVIEVTSFVVVSE